MSGYLRKRIAYWFFLIVGLLIVGYQCYKYITNQLDLSSQEIIITIIAVTLTLKPNLISDSWTALVNKFTNNAK